MRRSYLTFICHPARSWEHDDTLSAFIMDFAACWNWPTDKWRMVNWCGPLKGHTKQGIVDHFLQLLGKQREIYRFLIPAKPARLARSSKSNYGTLNPKENMALLLKADGVNVREMAGVGCPNSWTPFNTQNLSHVDKSQRINIAKRLLF